MNKPKSELAGRIEAAELRDDTGTWTVVILILSLTLMAIGTWIINDFRICAGVFLLLWANNISQIKVPK